MTWFDVIKISTEHAIRDAYEFAPEMIAEQKKLDEEEKDRALRLVRSKQEEAYLVPFEQLPRIKGFRTTSTRSSGWRGRKYIGRHGYSSAPIRTTEQSINYSKFLKSYIPYFLKDDELKEYRKNYRNITKWYNIFYSREPTAKDNQELENMKNRNMELHAAAMFRWKYYTRIGELYPEGWMTTEYARTYPFDLNDYDKKLREGLEQ